MGNGKTFTVVYIPTDPSEQIEEWEIEQPEGKEVECLLDRLKKHFSKNGQGNGDELKQKHKEALLAQLPEESRKNVSEDLLNTATAMQMVESVALLPHMKANNFVGINMYVDDKGAIKNLPLNIRASEIASCCGHPIEVKGDAFLGRVMDNEDEFDRMDFKLSEVSSSSEWIKTAKKYHEARMRQDSLQERYERLQSNTAAGPKIVELTPAEDEKEKGNAAFKAGKFDDALSHYSRALELDPKMCVAYNNRAMTHLKLNQYIDAKNDANKALEIDPGNVKALYRRGCACEALGDNLDAINDFKKVLELDPKNGSAKGKLASLEEGEKCD